MQIRTIAPKNYLCHTTRTTLNSIREIAEKEIGPLFEEAARAGIRQTGPLEFIYFDAGSDKSKPFTLWIALPVEGPVALMNSRYSFKEAAGFRCYTHVHHGDLSDLGQIYERLYAGLFMKGYKPSNQIREVYEKHESLVSPENITEIQIGIE